MDRCETLKTLLDEARAKKEDNLANMLEQALTAAQAARGGGTGSGDGPPGR